MICFIEARVYPLENIRVREERLSCMYKLLVYRSCSIPTSNDDEVGITGDEVCAVSNS
jgi:hypothetical protein